MINLAPKGLRTSAVPWDVLINGLFWVAVATVTIARIDWNNLTPARGSLLSLFLLTFLFGAWRALDFVFAPKLSGNHNWPKLTQYLEGRFSPAGRPHCNPLRHLFFPCLLLLAVTDNSMASLANPIAILCMVYIAAMALWEVVFRHKLRAFYKASPYPRDTWRWLGEASSHATNQELGVSVHPLIGDQAERIAKVRDSILERLDGVPESGVESENLTLNLRDRIIRSVEEATVEALLAGHTYVRGATERPQSFVKRMKPTNPTLAVSRMEAYAEAMTIFDNEIERAKESERHTPLLEHALGAFESFRKDQQQAGGSRCTLPESMFAPESRPLEVAM